MDPRAVPRAPGCLPEPGDTLTWLIQEARSATKGYMAPLGLGLQWALSAGWHLLRKDPRTSVGSAEFQSFPSSVYLGTGLVFSCVYVGCGDERLLVSMRWVELSMVTIAV